MNRGSFSLSLVHTHSDLVDMYSMYRILFIHVEYELMALLSICRHGMQWEANGVEAKQRMVSININIATIYRFERLYVVSNATHTQSKR